jgi:putative NADH-flavin reductase
MKVTIFGGTGTSGLLTIKKALSDGHNVTVYARNTSKINFKNENLKVILGELNEIDKIERAIIGSDAVITLLGPMNTSKELPISSGYKIIVNAMEKNGVRRMVAAVSSSYRDPRDRFQFSFDLGIWIIKMIARDSILREMEEMGRVIAESSLDWTMIRLPKLSNQAAKGKLNIGYTGDGKVKNFFLSRADLADVLVRQLNDNTYLHQAPVVSN